MSAIAVDSAGKILLGGNFDFFDGKSRKNIVEVNSDGSIDQTFNPGSGSNIEIFAIITQPNGKILIAGNFTSYNGIRRNRIARVFGNGDYCGFSSVLSIVGTTDTTATIK